VRSFAARVWLAAGLGIAIPALPALAEVMVLPVAERMTLSKASPSIRAAAPASQGAAPATPAGERSDRSELLMLVAGLTVLGIITLWRS
jgi:hypothetical protein